MHRRDKRKYHKHYGRHWGGGILGLLISGFAVKILWNFLIPSLFGGPVIGFLQAIGLVILGKFLTGGFFRGHCGGHSCGGHWEKRRAYWRQKMKEKMEGMSEEDKKKFKEGFMGGKWDVNIFEVEEEKDTEKDENSTDNPEGK